MVRHTTFTGASIRISRSIVRPGINISSHRLCATDGSTSGDDLQPIVALLSRNMLPSVAHREGGNHEERAKPRRRRCAARWHTARRAGSRARGQRASPAGKPAVESVRAAGRDLLHRDRGLHDRERRLDYHRPRTPFPRVRFAVAGDRVRADLRRFPAPRRPRRRLARTTTRAHGGPGGLHRRLTRWRPGHLGHLPHRDARDPGARDGARAAGRTIDRDEHVLRGSRTQQGPRHLGRGGRPGRDGWPAGRRNPHHLRRMAVHLLLQRPHRRGGARPGPKGGAREPRPQRTATLRRLRSRIDHRRPAGARLRHLPGAPGGLDGHPDRRHARRRRGIVRPVPRRRGQGRGTPAAPPALPPGQRRGIQRGRLPARDELPHLRVRGHALHAAGARLLRSRDGSGLDDGVGDLAGLRGPRPSDS